jgi:hypothetical protein
LSVPTDQQISEAEMDLACEIAIRVVQFLQTEKTNLYHEAIMRRIEVAMKKQLTVTVKPKPGN